MLHIQKVESLVRLVSGHHKEGCHVVIDVNIRDRSDPSRGRESGAAQDIDSKGGVAMCEVDD